MIYNRIALKWNQLDIDMNPPANIMTFSLDLNHVTFDLDHVTFDPDPYMIFIVTFFSSGLFVLVTFFFFFFFG